MRLIRVQQARSVWLLDISDLNPKGKEFADELVSWIKNRYQFAVVPDLKDIRVKAASGNAPGLIFKQGRFQANDGTLLEVASLAIHNDGLVVETTASTEESDRFISDLLTAGTKDFGLTYEPSMVRRKLYVSVLIVKSELDLSKTYPPLLAFAQKISAILGGVQPPHFFPAGIAFWSEPNDNGNHKTFTFAPEAGKSFSEHRHFSEAPLRTKDHLMLLEELESILKPSA